MRSNKELVNYLSNTKYLTSENVKKALFLVDRKYFAPSSCSNETYEDKPLSIGFNQTISAPSVVSFMLEKLELKKGMKVLELGTGSGYNTALLSELIGEKGKIITMERIPELTQLAKKNIAELGKAVRKKYKNISFVVGDGTLGYEKEKPYDRIIATASLPSLKPEHPLLTQLKSNGILTAPVGHLYWQNILVYKKKFNSYSNVLPVMFVPLIGEFGFKK